MTRFRKIKEVVKGMSFVKPLLLPVQRWRAQQLRREKKHEAQMFEEFVQHAFSNVEAGNLAIRVPNLGGVFEVDFRSHIFLRLLRKKDYEPELVMLAAEHLDSSKDVLDIGANIGLLTVFFAHSVQPSCKILAVEPTPLAQYYLRRNIEHNGISDSVIVFDGLVTDKAGEYTLNVIPGKEEYSSLGDIVHPSVLGENFQSINVKGETIDDLVVRFQLQPGFIKIDTEGAELFVLRGATQTLREKRPVPLMELSDRLLGSLNCSSKQVIALLQEHNYRVVNAGNLGADLSFPFDGSVLAIPQ